METSMAVFRGKGIRKTIHNNEWWFSVVNVCAILTESADPGASRQERPASTRDKMSRLHFLLFLSRCFNFLQYAPGSALSVRIAHTFTTENHHSLL